MEKLGLNEIREKYLSFFESKGHLRMPSFPLIPQNDNSILLINAGMTPLKPYFSGEATPPRKRVTTCQKCIRMPDVERVGKTARHGTYFEMLGNFSFGDYFKHEAINWSWEFLTQTLGLDGSRLWPSIYEDDDEAFAIWRDEVGVDEKKIVRLGKEDNFWEHGSGPCGPCSEIYYDRGEARGCGSPECKPGCDCDRFIEIWNNVFTQFNNDGKGNYSPLAQKNIDTGMGLERLACVMQDVENMFEVDTIRHIMEHVIDISGVKYGASYNSDISLRVITDHMRSTTFLVCDGVLPSNEGRGYVLRRLLRRAARHGRLLGIKEDFLYKLTDTVIDENRAAYPELVEKRDYIVRIVKAEEERFRQTIDAGLDILNARINAAKQDGYKLLPGADAFKLYDTYGFPVDLVSEILSEQDMSVDMDSFDSLMKEQRDRARKARAAAGDLAWVGSDLPNLREFDTKFVGYTKNETEAEVLLVVVGTEARGSASAGDEVLILLNETPFYGESGGQVGDAGIISDDHGLAITITYTKKTATGKYIHHGRVVSGTVSIGGKVMARIDMERRHAIMRAHSATHLLQKAIRDVIGTHAAQAGSYVEPDRLRFDFTHFEAITLEDIAKIELQVNRSVLAGYNINIKELPIAEARKLGAMALFGEKYGEIVRVINMGEGYSVEFCGGTHLDNTAKIGMFKIVSEASVAAGVRRIEAVTGNETLEMMNQKIKAITEASATLKTTPSELGTRVIQIMGEMRENAQSIMTLQMRVAAMEAVNLFNFSRSVKDVKVLAVRVDNVSTDILRAMGDQIREKAPNMVAVLSLVEGDKITFDAVCGAEAVKKGAHAGKLLKQVAALCGGGGGGRPDSASAGGKDVSKLESALEAVNDMVAAQLK